MICTPSVRSRVIASSASSWSSARLERYREESPQPGIVSLNVSILTAFAEMERHGDLLLRHDDALAALKKQVDFDEQFVLLFAWRGSGQDKLTYVVAESFPEQITFRIEPGRTRDLRPHVHIYALRSNVKWSVGK